MGNTLHLPIQYHKTVGNIEIKNKERKIYKGKKQQAMGHPHLSFSSNGSISKQHQNMSAPSSPLSDTSSISFASAGSRRKDTLHSTTTTATTSSSFTASNTKHSSSRAVSIVGSGSASASSAISTPTRFLRHIEGESKAKAQPDNSEKVRTLSTSALPSEHKTASTPSDMLPSHAMGIRRPSARSAPIVEYYPGNKPSDILSNDSITSGSRRPASDSISPPTPKKRNLVDKDFSFVEEDFSPLFASFIVGIVERGNKLIQQQDPLEVKKDRFAGSSLPQISIQEYIRRILRYLTAIARNEYLSGRDADVAADLAVRYMILAMVYIERLTQRRKFIVHERNIHRLLITAVTVASKMSDDVQPRNSYFARLGGIPLQELNMLEVEMCSLLSFRFHVDAEEFESKYDELLATKKDMGYSWSEDEGEVREKSAAAA